MWQFLAKFTILYIFRLSAISRVSEAIFVSCCV